MAVSDVLDRVRQPQYTGENRCLPCTGVNGVIAAMLAVAIARAAVTAGASWSTGLLVGVVVFLGATLLIYLRGYLVPGTPWFTKRYLPDRVLRWFDKHDQPSAVTTDEELDVEVTLQRAGAVTECDHADDLCLTDDFRAAWRDRIETVRTDETSRADLARLLDVEPDRLSIEEHGEAFVTHLDGRRAGQWESRAAFLADMAAAAVLRDRVDWWGSLDVTQRSSLLHGLRLFLERCPACDGPVTLGEEVVESCCRSFDVVAVTCQDCGARVFEVDHPG